MYRRSQASKHERLLGIAACQQAARRPFLEGLQREKQDREQHGHHYKIGSMTLSRRQALSLSAATAAAAVSSSSSPLHAAAAPPKKKMPIAVSTYSYWHFKGEKTPIENVILDAAKLGFDGVEILHRQMDNETTAYCNKLRKMAFENGLSLPMLSIHQDFV